MNDRMDDDEIPPYLGGRITDALHRQFDEVFGPGYIRRPDPQQHKETPHEQ